jgi:hypothetical protein
MKPAVFVGALHCSHPQTAWQMTRMKNVILRQNPTQKKQQKVLPVRTTGKSAHDTLTIRERK